jgi:hypothetical protein
MKGAMASWQIDLPDRAVQDVLEVGTIRLVETHRAPP